MIDITRHKQSQVIANDLENQIIGSSNDMEWKIDADWVKISAKQPDLTGDKTIQVRLARSDNRLAGPVVEMKFTANPINDKQQNISFKRLSVVEVSSEENHLIRKSR